MVFSSTTSDLLAMSDGGGSGLCGPHVECECAERRRIREDSFLQPNLLSGARGVSHTSSMTLTC